MWCLQRKKNIHFTKYIKLEHFCYKCDGILIDGSESDTNYLVFYSLLIYHKNTLYIMYYSEYYNLLKYFI